MADKKNILPISFPMGGGGMSRDLLRVTKGRGMELANAINSSRIPKKIMGAILATTGIAADDLGHIKDMTTVCALFNGLDGLARSEAIMADTGILVPKTMPRAGEDTLKAMEKEEQRDLRQYKNKQRQKEKEEAGEL